MTLVCQRNQMSCIDAKNVMGILGQNICKQGGGENCGEVGFLDAIRYIALTWTGRTGCVAWGRWPWRPSSRATWPRAPPRKIIVYVSNIMYYINITIIKYISGGPAPPRTSCPASWSRARWRRAGPRCRAGRTQSRARSAAAPRTTLQLLFLCFYLKILKFKKPHLMT